MKCQCYTCRTEDESTRELAKTGGELDKTLLKIDRIRSELTELEEEHTFHWEVTPKIQKSINLVKDFLYTLYEEHLEHMEEGQLPMKLKTYDVKVKPTTKKAKKILKRLEKKGMAIWIANSSHEEATATFTQLADFAKQAGVAFLWDRTETRAFPLVEDKNYVGGRVYILLDTRRNVIE